ncbi:MAG: putative baseplate assembly protein [Goleter apudmare HA4340-LM2]|jgi:hypothetical protein|nr:putative baseplate assembly protein [Goleter apudmare HA4340-LM2]
MAEPTPQIDERTAAEITKQVQELLQVYVPELQPTQKGTSAALIGVFARFAEIIIQRLNQVPDKNFLAFLNLLGASRLPPQPARVPLTFSLTTGTVIDAVVPAGTQVAAPPDKGEQEPVIFETERELVVTAAQLESVFIRNPEQDLYFNASEIAQVGNASGIAAFNGVNPIPHVLYIGNSQIFGLPEITSLLVTINLTKPLGQAGKLKWEVGNGDTWTEIIPTPEVSRNLQQIGNNQVNCGKITALSPSIVNNQPSRWLRCQLTTPIRPATATSVAGMVSAEELPVIQKITLRANINRNQLLVEQAFTNSIPADISKDFYPFGEKPKIGDVLYLANREVFSQANATVTLNVKLIQAGASDTDSLQLRWELWQDQRWQEIGTSTLTGPIAAEGTNQFRDTTKAFTEREAVLNVRQISFRLPNKLEATTVNGIENFWIRVRIVAGNYGKEANYRLKTPNKAEDGYLLDPATFVPPIIDTITLSYEATVEETPEFIYTYNDFVFWEQHNQAFAPFQPTTDVNKSLYLGFTLPAIRQAFPNNPLSLYWRLFEVIYGTLPDNPNASASPRLVWEYFNGNDWTQLLVNDETEALTRSGLVELLPPADIAPKKEFALSPRYWLRVRWISGDYAFEPKLQRLLLNTTTATQSVTIRDEILGSSDGMENQVFQTTRLPILSGLQLQVREPEIPAAQELATIIKEEGEDAVTTVLDLSGRPQEIWVRWHQVPDFYGSSPRDRHYVLNSLTGEIRFGNGLNGLIPPIGAGNIQLSKYQTGGGVLGNRLVGTIIQLKTTVPYIETVINPEPATGGADAESLDSLRARTPRNLRHGDRAVTIEDYEDLAMLASPEVVRAKCVPLRNLVDDPLDEKPIVLGEVSVIIVPDSNALKPLPSLELINRVQDYLATHAVPTVNIAVVGPLYVSVSVTVDIGLTSLAGASAVEQAVNQTLTRFLHPLTGGLDGQGWGFGREPYKSDFYALLADIPGVDHIRSLDVQDIEDIPGAKKTGRFLVDSGQHKISLVFAES